MQQLNTLNQQLGTIRQTYSETKKLAGFAEDAVNAFQGLGRQFLYIGTGSVTIDNGSKNGNKNGET